jgi:hypothetical protein
MYAVFYTKRLKLNLFSSEPIMVLINPMMVMYSYK